MCQRKNKDEFACVHKNMRIKEMNINLLRVATYHITYIEYIFFVLIFHHYKVFGVSKITWRSISLFLVYRFSYISHCTFMGSVKASKMQPRLLLYFLMKYDSFYHQHIHTYSCFRAGNYGRFIKTIWWVSFSNTTLNMNNFKEYWLSN